MDSALTKALLINVEQENKLILSTTAEEILIQSNFYCWVVVMDHKKGRKYVFLLRLHHLFVLDYHGLDNEKTVRHSENGIRWKLTSKLDDLDFADDEVLLCSTKQHMQEKTSRMEEEGGLDSRSIEGKQKPWEKVKHNGEDIEDVDEVTYPGATVMEEGWRS